MVLVSCPPRVKRGEDGKIKSAKGKLYPLFPSSFSVNARSGFALLVFASLLPIPLSTKDAALRL